MNTITVEENYGHTKVGREYKIINEGLDFITIKCQGKPFNVPKHIISPKKYYTKTNTYNLPTYEDIIEAEEID